MMPETEEGNSVNNGSFELLCDEEGTQKNLAAPAAIPSRRNPRLENVIATSYHWWIGVVFDLIRKETWRKIPT